MKRIFAVAVLAILNVLVGGYAVASDRTPPPKTSVQEPTDWTSLNAGPDGIDMHARTLIIQGHECVLVTYVGNYSRGGVGLSCLGAPNGR